MAWLAKAVLTEEERHYIKAIALELFEIRRQLMHLAEAIVKLNEKDFQAAFNISKEDFTDSQVDDYSLSLQKKADAAEYELR